MFKRRKLLLSLTPTRKNQVPRIVAPLRLGNNQRAGLCFCPGLPNPNDPAEHLADGTGCLGHGHRGSILGTYLGEAHSLGLIR